MPNFGRNWLNASWRKKAEMPDDLALRFIGEPVVVVDDGQHNAFTDLVSWHGYLWLVYVSSPSHFSSQHSRVVLLRSKDARIWEEAARFDGQGEDIRDPKLASMGEHLVIYVLLNRSFDPRPYRTVRSWSSDGKTWSPFSSVLPVGWLLGHPKASPTGEWYAPAHNIKLGSVQLFRSRDGLSWEPHAMITHMQGADETAIEFLPDGRLFAVTRVEAGGGIFGTSKAGTLLSVSKPPYQSWTPSGLSSLTRLDGPALYRIGEKIYALGRYQPHVTHPLGGSGSIFSRKRTSIFCVGDGDLTWLVDLPSAGDTAYPGVAAWDGKIVISYYTSDPRRDPPWILGMLNPTSVRVVILTGDL
jgi:hypothetical protein